jgi:hypothetical protein
MVSENVFRLGEVEITGSNATATRILFFDFVPAVFIEFGPQLKKSNGYNHIYPFTVEFSNNEVPAGVMAALGKKN